MFEITPAAVAPLSGTLTVTLNAPGQPAASAFG